MTTADQYVTNIIIYALQANLFVVYLIINRNYYYLIAGEFMGKTVRYSKKREAIFNKLISTDIHPSAEWIYRNLKSDYPDLSLGTVYRNLSKFKEDGSIISIGFVNGQERFDGNTTPHSHFICRKCGAVIDMHELKLDVDLNKAASKLYNYKIEGHELIFRGLCDKCAGSP